MMHISEKGIKLITELEGCRSHAYADVAGLMTIGIGHLITVHGITIDGVQIDYRRGLTEEQINDILLQDLMVAELAINGLHITLKQHEFDSICSFIFNVGVGNFKSSTLYKRLLDGNFADVPAQMRRWNKAGGRVIQGLINRREKEIAFWKGQG